jgi:hypothetical protein
MFVQPELTEEEGEGAFLTYTNWIGFVAVATDEGAAALGRRDIVVAWRGSVKPGEFLKDFDTRHVSAETLVGPSDKFAEVHRGFMSVYTGAPGSYETHLHRGQTTDPSLIMTSARDQVNLRFPETYVKYYTPTLHSLT